jgi:hypothetical protein
MAWRCGATDHRALVKSPVIEVLNRNKYKNENARFSMKCQSWRGLGSATAALPGELGFIQVPARSFDCAVYRFAQHSSYLKIQQLYFD